MMTGREYIEKRAGVLSAIQDAIYDVARGISGDRETEDNAKAAHTICVLLRAWETVLIIGTKDKEGYSKNE